MPTISPRANLLLTIPVLAGTAVACLTGCDTKSEAGQPKKPGVDGKPQTEQVQQGPDAFHSANNQTGRLLASGVSTSGKIITAKGLGTSGKVFDPKTTLPDDDIQPKIFDPKTTLPDDDIQPKIFDPKTTLLDDDIQPKIFDPKTTLPDDDIQPKIFDPKTTLPD